MSDHLVMMKTKKMIHDAHHPSGMSVHDGMIHSFPACYANWFVKRVEQLEQHVAEMERTAGLRWPNHYAAREEGRKEFEAKVQELEQQLKDKDQQLLEENLHVKRLEQQLAECKLDLCMAITKEQELVDAEIEIANMKVQNAKLFDALKKIANKKWIVEHRPANEMQDIANAALKEILNGQV